MAEEGSCRLMCGFWGHGTSDKGVNGLLIQTFRVVGTPVVGLRERFHFVLGFGHGYLAHEEGNDRSSHCNVLV